MTTDTKNTGGCAFPLQPHSTPEMHHLGMTLRDWFAGQALANPAICKLDDEWPQKTAYSFADAMLEARDQ